METSNPASGFPPTHPRAPVRPRIIPVLDVLGGRVVHAVGGRRSDYLPVRSELTDSTKPVEVAHALIRATGAGELYVADLDALQHGGLSVASAELAGLVCATLLLDAGGLIPTLYAARVRRVIPSEAGLTPEQAGEFAGRPGHPAGPVFSLDLVDGKLCGNWRRWGARDAGDWRALVRRAHHLGIRSFIVLDVAYVGADRGVGTADVCRSIRDEFGAVEIITGGGVRGWTDVERLAGAGADAILVASALHDGALTLPRPPS
jgi:phosphoribosylformimino-5-aminoimidazole carboxamide ribotide isomerase